MSSPPSQISPSSPHPKDEINKCARTEVFDSHECHDWIEDNREEENKEENIGGNKEEIINDRQPSPHLSKNAVTSQISQSNRTSEYDYDMASLPAHFVCVDMMVLPLIDEDSDESQSNLSAPSQTGQSKVVPLTDEESDESQSIAGSNDDSQG